MNTKKTAIIEFIARFLIIQISDFFQEYRMFMQLQFPKIFAKFWESYCILRNRSCNSAMRFIKSSKADASLKMKAVVILA